MKYYVEGTLHRKLVEAAVSPRKEASASHLILDPEPLCGDTILAQERILVHVICTLF